MIIAENYRLYINRIVNSKPFEFFIIGIIFIVAFLLGLTTFNLPPEHLVLIHNIDTYINYIFLTEIILRMSAEKSLKDYFSNPWNVFDFIVVIAVFIPFTQEYSALARVLRVFRVLRLITILPELQTIVISLIQSTKSIIYILGLMVIFFYIYGVIGSILFSSINPELWGDVFTSMLTLFTVMTFDGWTTAMYGVTEAYPFAWIYFLTFIFITTFTFLNMIIGVVINSLDRENQKSNEIERERMSRVTDDLHTKLDEIEEKMSVICDVLRDKTKL